MKNTDLPTLADVAQIIAPNNTLPWLEQILGVYGAEIDNDRKLQDALPSKAVVKKQLIEVKRAAEKILKFLNESPTMVFLEMESNIEIHVARLESDLRQFAKAAEVAAISPAITDASGKTKKGRGRAVARAWISPTAFCALVVAETWLSARGRRPSVRNQAAARAAQAFWLTCGGTAGWGSDPRAG
jgi:hypothetical protein